MRENAAHILQQVFGYPEFRPGQLDIVLSVMQGRDTLALLPTGGGKSICFQVPALAREGICLVISPLIALMKDQVDNLRKRGILSAAIYSGMGRREIDTVLDNCIYGNYRFLYVSPERLKTEVFIERFKQMKVNLIAVDEAHCISQWGYDFRPPYLEIAKIRDFQPQAPFLALTASATLEVKHDIVEKLGLKDPQVFVRSFIRKNLSYSVRMAENKLEKAIEILQKIPGAAIIYVRSRKGTKDVTVALQQLGISATFYHAGLDNATREARQGDWKSNQVRVMVATNAFGMGIDKPDVRLVVHLDIPENLENYYQEAGRAGRDEHKAYAVLITNKQDLGILDERAQKAYPPSDFLKKVYQCLANHYRMAVGSGLMASFDFDLPVFVDQYNLETLSTYNALKVLQEEGLLEMSESFFVPSTLHFLVDQARLYEFQIANAKLDPLIKVLLRTFGGELFVDYLKIQESKVAKYAGVPEAELVKQLSYLDQVGILAYHPRKDKPQITFLTERYDAGKLPIDVRRIEARKQNHLAKAKAMADYAKGISRCRSLQIAGYFGEDNDKTCGICDVCIRGKKNRGDQEQKIRNRILETLDAGKEFSLHTLHRVPGLSDVGLTAQVLRELEDEGLLSTARDGTIKRKN